MGADSENAVAAKLKEMGYTPVSITEAKEEMGIADFFEKFRFYFPCHKLWYLGVKIN